MSKWEKIGEVAIDSGTIALVDACHLREGASEASMLHKGWELWRTPVGQHLGSGLHSTMTVKSAAGVDLATFVSTAGDAMLEVLGRRNAKGLIEEIRVVFPWAAAHAADDDED